MLKLMECYKIKNNDVIMIVIDRYVDDFGPESLENICSSCKGLKICHKIISDNILGLDSCAHTKTVAVCICMHILKY